MFKESKINKSPIQSILQQSFGQLPSSSNLRMNRQQFHDQHRNDIDSQHRQFKISNNNSSINPYNGNVNLQHKLKLVQLMGLTQLQISVSMIVSILKNKVLNRTSFTMLKLKRIQNNKNLSNVIQKQDKNIVIRKMQLFCQKIQVIFAKKKIKNLGISFIEIYMFKLKAIVIDNKSSSIVSPYRYERIQNSQRGDSQWQLAQSQGQIDNNQSLIKQNKYLKKKKQKVKANKQEFCQKIDQLLSIHENFLNKK